MKDDLISRQDAIKALKEAYEDIDAEFILEKLPPAQKWIPVEERLPDCDAIMFVTYNDPRTHERMMWCGWYEMEDFWYIDGKEHSREYGNEVVAWMPMPEPYAPTQSNDSKALDSLGKGGRV